MIYLLDCNAMVCLLEEGIRIVEEYRCHVPHEIEAEFKGSPSRDMWYKQSEFITPDIDRALYLREYADILNRYKDVSFYNLKSLGDVAILANASVLLKGGKENGSLFPDSVCIVTGDAGIKKFVLAEYPRSLCVISPNDFAA